ncbi:MAG: hypothetical protein JST64_05835 [Actinobacteria bacterium]|nr:hypothetical protein [Actinomycetota bacterium]
MTKKSMSTVAAVVAATAVLLTSGCSQKYTAERDAKKFGEAICDVRQAESPDQAKSAMEDARKQMDDLAGKYSMFTAEDRKDVQNNLADLHEHAIQGNTVLMRQDLAVLGRSIRHIAQDSDEVTRAAWEGVAEGLADCTQ